MLKTPAKLTALFFALGVYISPPFVPDQYRPIVETLAETIEETAEDLEARKKRVKSDFLTR